MRPSIPDLLLAAMAEKAALTVLAVDKDFDLTAAITSQAVQTLDAEPRAARHGIALGGDRLHVSDATNCLPA